MKKFVVVVILIFASVFGALLWESSFTYQTDSQQIEAFQQRLHREETLVDEILENLSIVEVGRQPLPNRQVLLLGFRSGELIYWSDKKVGTPDLYKRLKEAGNLIKLNNAYYDVRMRMVEDMEFFALIFLRDDYPFINEYIQNETNTSLGINRENAAKIIIPDSFDDGDMIIHNREGEPLFQISTNVQYKDRLPNYFILILYAIALFLTFYAYKIGLVQSRSLSTQLLWMLFFISFFVVIRYLMFFYKVPNSLYQLSIFEGNFIHRNISLSVGDLFLTMFILVHLIYITLQNISISYNSKIARYRYLFLIAFVVGTFFYINFIHYSINSLIDNTQVSLNIARIINIDLFSIIAFITSVIGAMGLVIIIDGGVRYFDNFFSLKEVIVSVALLWSCGAIVSNIGTLSISPWECVFVFCLYVISVINRYMLEGDARKSIFLISIVAVSVYIVHISKERESYRELAVRSYYANELIQERDTMFETKLVEIDKALGSERLIDLLKYGNEKKIESYLFDEEVDLTGYHYNIKIILQSSENSSEISDSIKNMDHLIDSLGIKIKSTSFYNIDDFDGVTTYIGRVHFSNGGELYIRFDSDGKPVRGGYQQLLSKRPLDQEKMIYPYSYAKYKNGILLESSGTYGYYKNINRLNRKHDHAETISEKEYSHMIIPVGDGGLFIISFNNIYFAPYNLNVLYAILVCLIFSSYGIIFYYDKNIWETFDNTLKKRIKNNIIILVIMLLVITSILSIVITSTSFKQRQLMEVVKLSSYVNKELESMPCVDASICPKINELLEKIVEVTQVDVNIYDQRGYLSATSMPLIFEKGYEGCLLNPEAYHEIIQKGNNSFVQNERIGELDYISTYILLELDNGMRYVLNLPYFTKNDELNRDILLLVVIFINVAMMVIVLAFFLSGVVAERVMKPLHMIYEKMREVHLGGKNERIEYTKKDEIGALVREYNNMVDKLEDSVKKLSKVEREGAWREMARQIAHEIKNPLTPMKLNIQFMQRTLQGDNPEEIKRKFEDISVILIEQIDHMASIATAFSDFAKVSVANNELFNFSEMVERCVVLFKTNVAKIDCSIEPDLFLYGDIDQINRVLVNLLKNAEQSIPEDREKMLSIELTREGREVKLTIKDNGIGIPKENYDKIFEPNFTTKSGGMGLGLALSYKIIESMGGKIYFESEESFGTVFYITLPSIDI